MKTIKIVCLVVIAFIIASSFPVLAENDNISKKRSNEQITFGDYNNEYREYSKSIEDVDYIKNDIALSNPSSSSDSFRIEDNVIILKEGKTSFDFYADNDSKFIINFDYKVVNEDFMDANIGVSIDDSYSFLGCKSIDVKRYWVDSGKMRKDDLGNEFAAEQVPYDGFVNRPLSDNSGANVLPYEFAVSKGKHTVGITVNSGEIAVTKITLSAPDDSAELYKDKEKEYKRNGYKNYSSKPIVIEGEDAALKNSNSIVPKSDNTSKLVTPSSASTSLVNYIGGTNWKNSTEEIVWNVDVQKTGLYKLGIMAKQDQIVNGCSYRHLKIDGKTPFFEASELTFEYSTDWKLYEFGSDNEPYLFYLEKGEHQLSLSVTLGPQADFYSRLKQCAEKLGDFYIDVVMITGETPDSNRDYELFKQIEDFYDILDENYNELKSLASDVKKLTGERGNNYTAAIENMMRVIKQMKEHSYSAQDYVKDFYSNYVTLNSWLYEMTVMPLSLDRIFLTNPKGEYGEKQVSLLSKMFFGIERFLFSFADEYSSINDSNNSEEIKIWVNWGRDQAQVLSSLINESFTPSTGIKVNLEIVNADLIKGILSNTQPDLALHMSRATPLNLAMRGALYDLSKFDDYDEIMKRFGDSSGLPYEYNGGHYALPDQQSFYLMFYRKDIFEKLNLSIPETWDEFLATTAVLQRNNMNSYIPYTKITAANTTDTGIGGLNLFASILMQMNGKMYNESKTKSLITDTTSLNSFEFWTEFYTEYKLPTEADFYNRFRVGTCPLGISVYTQYTTFLQAAPEIQDRWGIALVPGTVQKDGSINRKVSGAGTGCAILNKSNKKSQAWEFLKWWTSNDTQVRFNSNVESILGAVARTTTANIDAFSKMGWKKSDLEVLLKQREQIVEIPEVPGSYYLTRAVDQAYWSVINGNSSVKDAIDKWGKEANLEIKRKISEYQGEKR